MGGRVAGSVIFERMVVNPQNPYFVVVFSILSLPKVGKNGFLCMSATQD